MPAATNRRFKILYIDTENFWRGGQDQLYSLMTGMRSRGNTVWLAAPGVSPLYERASAEGFEVADFHQRYELSMRAVIRLRDILEKGQFDIVHSNTPRSLISARLAARWARTSVTVCSRRVNFPLRGKRSTWKYNWSTDRILTVSSSIMETLISAGVRESLVEVVYEGVDLEWLDRQQTTRLTEPDDCIAVGTVAHMSPEKGHADLLEAIGMLSGSFPNVRFYLVGEGELRAELEVRAKRLGIERVVTFAGFRSDADALMKQFNLFCLPSLSEGLSSAILAAMGSRLPVVSTSVGGVPELVVDGTTGILVSPGRPAELANALKRLLADPGLCERMGAAGRRRVEKNFTIERKLDATEVSYSRLLEESGIR